VSAEDLEETRATDEQTMSTDKLSATLRGIIRDLGAGREHGGCPAALEA
jgi:hypothetical protein